MRNLILIFLILVTFVSCTKKESSVTKQYIYSEIVYESYIIDGVTQKFIKNEDTIEAKSDEEAYKIAEAKFNESKLADNNVKKITAGDKIFLNGDSGVWYSETVEFRLFDLEGNIIKK